MKQTEIFSDPILIGSVAGVVGNLPKLIATLAFQNFGWMRYTFSQLAAGVFMKKEVLSNPLALTIGYVVDFTVAALLGVILIYIIRNTGNDYEIYKGLLVGLASYIFLYGLMLRLDITTGNLATPWPNFLGLFLHVLFGLVAGWIVSRYSRVN